MTAAFSMAMSSIARSGTQPTDKPNITGSDKVAFVGGAADDTFGAGVVREKYEAYIKVNGEDSAAYFEWTDADALSTYVGDHNGRVTIVAHSYGADEAAHLVAGGMKVHKLITVDPVGWTRPSMQAISNNAVIWNNFDSTGTSGYFWNNAVATVGGAWNSLPSEYATMHTVSNYDHVAICSVYCSP
ncbi:hypothetical protein ACJJI5_05970 [Microbulbifer sp. EKSA008]|uniref:hypothetical protein n=1 Tax=Microbulbifer sp. EKSA008 TaxID=3243367 RepID=UPI004041CEA6